MFQNTPSLGCFWFYSIYYLMANFLIFVTSPANETPVASIVYQFCRAALDDKHIIDAIFFYGAGVTHANIFQVPQAGEPFVYDCWKKLADNAIPLLVCASAASRRGIIDHQEAQQYQQLQGSLSPTFTLSGLTEFAALSKQATRVVQF